MSMLELLCGVEERSPFPTIREGKTANKNRSSLGQNGVQYEQNGVACDLLVEEGFEPETMRKKWGGL